MSGKGIALCLAVLLVCIGMAACGPTPTPVLSERLIVQIDFSSWIQETFTVSPDGRRVAYGVVRGGKAFVVVDGKEGKRYDGIVTTGGGRIVFDSADSPHYLAAKGDDIYLVEERIQRDKERGERKMGFIRSTVAW